MLLCDGARAEVDQFFPKTGKDVPAGEYGFAFLGDLHFDRLEHHDMAWVREHHPGDVRQIRNYSRITEQTSPALLEAVSGSLRGLDIPAFAIIQAGDFVEGLCGSYELQVRQFREAMAFVGPCAASVPFLLTKGNHEVTGPGAHQAYADTILPWLGKQLGSEVRETSFHVQHGGDLFVFFDAYRPDLDWLEEVLSEHPARWVFFVIHQPVVPYNARSQWHIFSRPEQAGQRSRLLTLLGKNRVIVLSGHLHHYAALRRATKSGAFVQLSLNSVVDGEDHGADLLEGVARYTPALVDSEPGFSAGTVEERRELLKQEQPYITYFESADMPGFGVVRVSDTDLRIEVCRGSSRRTWRHLVVEKPGLQITVKGDASMPLPAHFSLELDGHSP